jgi:hypothetical protein
MMNSKANFFVLLIFFIAKNFSSDVGAVGEVESITKYSADKDLHQLSPGELNSTVNGTSFLVQEDIEYGYEEDESGVEDNVSSPYPRGLDEITANDIFSAVDSAITDSSFDKENTTNSSKPVYSVGELKDLVARLENKTDEASAGEVEKKMDEIVLKLNNATHQDLELDEDDLLDHAYDDEEEEEEEGLVNDASEAQNESEAQTKSKVQNELEAQEAYDRSLNDLAKRRLNKKGMKKMLRCKGGNGKNTMGKCQQQMPAQIVAPQPAALIPAPLVTALYSAPTQATVPPAMVQTHLSPVHMY